MNRIGLVVAAILTLAAVSFLPWNAQRAAWAIGSPMKVVAEPVARPMTVAEAKKIEAYMRHVLGNQAIRLVHVAPEAEVYLGDHFLGVIFPDDQKEGRTFYFEMSIYDTEIEESPPGRRQR